AIAPSGDREEACPRPIRCSSTTPENVPAGVYAGGVRSVGFLPPERSRKTNLGIVHASRPKATTKGFWVTLPPLLQVFPESMVLMASWRFLARQFKIREITSTIALARKVKSRYRKIIPMATSIVLSDMRQLLSRYRTGHGRESIHGAVVGNTKAGAGVPARASIISDSVQPVIPADDRAAEGRIRVKK